MGIWKRLFGADGDSGARRETSGRPPLDHATPNFMYPLEVCRAADIPKRLTTLCKRTAQRGATLILIGDQEDVAGLAEQQEINDATPQQYLEQAAQVDIERWLRLRVELDPEAYECEQGEWPATRVSPPSLMAHLDIRTNKPKPRVYLATIPTPRSWETPAFLKYGNWNECPDAQYHVALAKRWHEQFGAVIIAVTRDTIEFEVARPPTDRATSMRLAHEQFSYCSDIVFQGLETLEMLAATLLNGRYWYFWWD